MGSLTRRLKKSLTHQLLPCFHCGIQQAVPNIFLDWPKPRLTEYVAVCADCARRWHRCGQFVTWADRGWQNADQPMEAKREGDVITFQRIRQEQETAV